MFVRIAPRAHISELVEYRAPAKTQAFPSNRFWLRDANHTYTKNSKIDRSFRSLQQMLCMLLFCHIRLTYPFSCCRHGPSLKACCRSKNTPRLSCTILHVYNFFLVFVYVMARLFNVTNRPYSPVWPPRLFFFPTLTVHAWRKYLCVTSMKCKLMNKNGLLKKRAL